MNKRSFFSLLALVVLLGTSAPTAFAATKTSSLEFSGWIPYWRTEAGVADTIPHLKQLTEVNPFGYTVKSDGTLNDAANIKSATWQKLFKEAKAKKVRVVPTVMWSDTAAIHTVLSDPKLRAKHIKSIVSVVKENNFDGIDIDYEGKLAEDKDNYSAFLKELSAEFAKGKGNKWLMCTIEARTPPDSLYSNPSVVDIQYANDFVAINKYCDRVRLMTYDQQRADIKLNAAHKGELYAPIADPEWIKKVVALTTQTIDKKKLVLGVATYGYIYQVMPFTDGSGYGYTKLEAFNPRYGVETAAANGITPTRNAAGELSFSYVPKTTVSSLPSNKTLSALAPKGTTSANLAAAGALALAKTKGKQAPVQLVWWSDAQAIKEKVALARKLGLKGVAVFKFDGGQDPQMWSVLK
ncbi:MAG: spore peptidoglycan hydrolase (N-acetylglucosaminidase) [Parcubacteria bacterium C7867-007]|nr:MAG: spore peptidoglycan hydrolase (N-acetylglucosaminidase) [Parcubacteria bacterium C7867-007]